MDKHTYTYKTVGSCEINADVYGAFEGGRRPAIVWIHGGALILGNREGINSEQLRAYVDAGYAVVSIDYRLAPETKLPGILDDLRDAFRWIREEAPERFPLDPDRMAVVGHSAGGYLTLMSGFAVDPRPRALVSFYGYGDITGAWYSRPDPFYCQQPIVPDAEARGGVGGRVVSQTAGPEDGPRYRFYLYCRQRGIWPKEVMGRDPDAEPGAFDPFCPVRNVGPYYPPALLLHGDRDNDVPYEQSVQMSGALARAGVECELITIPDGEHGFDHRKDDPTVADAFRRVLGFLDRHLNPPANPRADRG